MKSVDFLSEIFLIFQGKEEGAAARMLAQMVDPQLLVVPPLLILSKLWGPHRLGVKVLEMTEQRFVPKEEMDRLVALQTEKGTKDAVHVELCKFYWRREGCRFGDACTQWHSNLGAQVMDEDNHWDRT